MWDKVTPEEGLQRERELKSDDSPFKPLLDEGASMMRHERTAESATKVINHLLGKSPTTTQIVRELLQEKKTLEETAAGTELHSDIHALLKRHESEMESLKNELKRESESRLAEERRRTEKIMAELLKELDELKRGIPGKCVSSKNTHGTMLIRDFTSVTLPLCTSSPITSLPLTQNVLCTVPSFFD